MMTSFSILVLAATVAIVAVTGVAVAQMGLLGRIDLQDSQSSGRLVHRRPC